jgi:hypothetical protein
MLNIQNSMKRWLLIISVFVISLLSFTSCEFIGDIFEAGIWTGIIIVILIVALIIYIISKMRS